MSDEKLRSNDASPRNDSSVAQAVDPDDNWAAGVRQAASIVRAEAAQHPGTSSANLLASLAEKLDGVADHYPSARRFEASTDPAVMWATNAEHFRKEANALYAALEREYESDDGERICCAGCLDANEGGRPTQRVARWSDVVHVDGCALFRRGISPKAAHTSEAVERERRSKATNEHHYACVNGCGASVPSHTMHCENCLRAFNAGREWERRPEAPPPKATCGWCRGNPIGHCAICQAKPSTPETYADDPVVATIGTPDHEAPPPAPLGDADPDLLHRLGQELSGVASVLTMMAAARRERASR